MPLASDTHGRPLSSLGSRTSIELPKPAGVNKNTNWLSSTGAWAFYVGLIALLWLLVSLFVDPGLAWTWVNIIHGVGTFYLFHWVKVRSSLAGLEGTLRNLLGASTVSSNYAQKASSSKPL